jgi:hypothetical protein
MAIKFNRSQTFATNGTVTAAGLHNLIDGTDIYQALITDQTAMTSVGSLDKLLIADSDLTAGDAPRSVTVNELFEDALTLSTYTNVNAVNLKYTSATGNYTLSTGATITNGTITNGVIPTGTFGTTTSTAATITTGTIPTLTAGTTTSTAANITTGTLANLVATTSTFNGTITGSTNIINIGSGQIYKDASGNVGIGTASPAAKLNVYDASSATIFLQGDSTTQVFMQRASANATSPQIDLRKSRGSIASPAAVNTGDFLGFINFQAFGGTNNRILSRIYGQAETYVSDTNISSNLVFQTSAAGGVLADEKMRITGDGNVGIGTTSPAYKLDVNGAARINSAFAQLALTDTTGGTTTGGFIRYVSNGASGSYTYQINTAAAGDFTTANNVYTVSSAGNISIGTATALSKLHVHGDLTLSNATVSTTAATGGLTLPATAAGYLTVSINGTSRKIPYYA